ncbi:MAG: hypothetical protein LIP12_09545 [Clostridiales bacterium]|nr:hypothetical protein [Clostridiales bacterium]
MKEENDFTLAIRFRTDDGISYDTASFEMPFRADCNICKCLEYLKQAAYDYTNSDKGQAILQKNNGVFRWLDLIEIPDEFLARYNIRRHPFGRHISFTVNSGDPIRDIRNE